jgi:hypothetical protein
MNTSTSNNGKKDKCWIGTGIVRAALCAGACFGAPFAWADDIPFISNEADSSQKQGYDPSWTAEDYMNAQPLTVEVDYYKWSNSALQTESKAFEQKGAPKVGEGMAPTGDNKPDLEHFIHPPIQSVETGTTQQVNESSYNGENIAQPESIPYLPFSSSLVNLLRAAARGNNAQKTLEENEQRTDLLFPYSTIGRLFFRKQDGQGYWCSGAVIKPRLVVTAGQCVHSGNGDESGWYKDFKFIPAYRNGSAPFGEWYGRALVTVEWYHGGGTVPNSADYAVLEIQDQNGKKIWENVGHLGWAIKTETRDTCTQELHGLGYPDSIAGVPNSTEEMRQITGKGAAWEGNPK